MPPGVKVPPGTSLPPPGKNPVPGDSQIATNLAPPGTPAAEALQTARTIYGQVRNKYEGARNVITNAYQEVKAKVSTAGGNFVTNSLNKAGLTSTSFNTMVGDMAKTVIDKGIDKAVGAAFKAIPALRTVAAVDTGIEGGIQVANTVLGCNGQNGCVRLVFLSTVVEVRMLQASPGSRVVTSGKGDSMEIFFNATYCMDCIAAASQNSLTPTRIAELITAAFEDPALVSAALQQAAQKSADPQIAAAFSSATVADITVANPRLFNVPLLGGSFLLFLFLSS